MLANLLLEPGKIDYREVETPSPGPEEVLVKISSALTCGTDLKAFLRGHPKMPMPTLFGHEFAGVAAQVGSRVRGVREGDAIMAVPTAPCMSCFYCRRGQENLCTTIMDRMVLGAYAEYIKLPAQVVNTNTFQKPDCLSFPEAALLEPLSCVVHGLSKVRLRRDDVVLILGAGAIGLLHLLVLKDAGVENIIVAGRRPHRTKVAERLGASVMGESNGNWAREILFDATDGRGADVVVECTGQPAVWEQAITLARPGGTVVLFGGCPPGTRVSLDTVRLHYDQISLLSPFHFTPRDVRKAYELLAEGRVDGKPLISGTYQFGQLMEALTLLQRGEGVKFAMIP